MLKLFTDFSVQCEPDVTAVPERFVAARHEHVDHHAQTEHVRGGAGVVTASRLAPRDLRGHEAHRAGEGDLGSPRSIQVLGEAKINQFDLNITMRRKCGEGNTDPVLLPVSAPHHDVLRLEVQVDHSSLVDEVKALDDLSHELDAGLLVQVVAAGCHFLK